jgi:hypothetical protein
MRRAAVHVPGLVVTLHSGEGKANQYLMRGAGSTALGDGSLLAALELQHYDGPWVAPGDQRKINTVLRYSEGDRQNGDSLTGAFYHVYVRNLGPWSGGLVYRYLGALPLSSGPCANSAVATAPGEVYGHGEGEWHGDVRYAFAAGWSAALSIYNLFDKKADAMEYWYVDRLPGGPAAGVADLHVHPLEPISLRLTLARKF